jgi:hypothetical protein
LYYKLVARGKSGIVYCMAGQISEYKATILKQRQEREDRFRNSERGWLGLAGLFWLRDGENRVGSADDNDIMLHSDVPDHIGIVIYNNGIATFRAAQRNAEKLHRVQTIYC